MRALIAILITGFSVAGTAFTAVTLTHQGGVEGWWSPPSYEPATPIAILEGGIGGGVSLDTIDAVPLPFAREILDASDMHSSTFPTCVVVPVSARYRIVAAAVFELDESGTRELYFTATAPGGTPKLISELLSVVPDQTFQMRQAIYTVDHIDAGDCVELWAGAPGHGSSDGGLWALAVGFALWEN